MTMTKKKEKKEISVSNDVKWSLKRISVGSKVGRDFREGVARNCRRCVIICY